MAMSAGRRSSGGASPSGWRGWSEAAAILSGSVSALPRPNPAAAEGLAAIPAEAAGVRAGGRLRPLPFRAPRNTRVMGFNILENMSFPDFVNRMAIFVYRSLTRGSWQAAGERRMIRPGGNGSCGRR